MLVTACNSNGSVLGMNDCKDTFCSTPKCNSVTTSLEALSISGIYSSIPLDSRISFDNFDKICSGYESQNKNYSNLLCKSQVSNKMKYTSENDQIYHNKIYNDYMVSQEYKAYTYDIEKSKESILAFISSVKDIENDTKKVEEKLKICTNFLISSITSLTSCMIQINSHNRLLDCNMFTIDNGFDEVTLARELSSLLSYLGSNEALLVDRCNSQRSKEFNKMMKSCDSKIDSFHECLKNILSSPNNLIKDTFKDNVTNPESSCVSLHTDSCVTSRSSSLDSSSSTRTTYISAGSLRSEYKNRKEFINFVSQNYTKVIDIVSSMVKAIDIYKKIAENLKTDQDKKDHLVRFNYSLKNFSEQYTSIKNTIRSENIHVYDECLYKILANTRLLKCGDLFYTTICDIKNRFAQHIDDGFVDNISFIKNINIDIGKFCDTFKRCNKYSFNKIRV
ncbi:hypothetical protein ACRRVD_02345 [Candidatus Cardinium hertigii]|uniref:hypothetical protein n=1 Tax=Candidatus Cardinium hertigii TaxID=247481 RepID=UPI003D7E5838